MATRLAIVDPGSFVLPYDFHLVKALARAGHTVDFYGSTTHYNGEFLDAMRALPGVAVHAKAISGSVAPRWRGALAYAAQLAQLLRRASRYEQINLQFSGFWPLEWLVLGLLRRRFVFTVHNAVPHGFAGDRHRPTLCLARLAARLVFVSEATRDDFLRRYGDAFSSKATVLPHGLLPVTPDAQPVPYLPVSVPAPAPRRLVFWGRVQPYKGVELFRDLARSQEVRRRGLCLAVYGAWSPDLQALRDELRELGVEIHDAYLAEADLLKLLSSDDLFLLPYQRASQSGALYALLAHGRLFCCSDSGDLGAFMRRFDLEALLLRERNADAVLRCLDHLEAHAGEVAAALDRAQHALRWERILAQAEATPHEIERRRR